MPISILAFVIALAWRDCNNSSWTFMIGVLNNQQQFMLRKVGFRRSYVGEEDTDLFVNKYFGGNGIKESSHGIESGHTFFFRNFAGPFNEVDCKLQIW